MRYDDYAGSFNLRTKAVHRQPLAFYLEESLEKAEAGEAQDWVLISIGNSHTVTREIDEFAAKVKGEQL